MVLHATLGHLNPRVGVALADKGLLGVFGEEVHVEGQPGDGQRFSYRVGWLPVGHRGGVPARAEAHEECRRGQRGVRGAVEGVTRPDGSIDVIEGHVHAPFLRVGGRMHAAAPEGLQ